MSDDEDLSLAERLQRRGAGPSSGLIASKLPLPSKEASASASPKKRKGKAANKSTNKKQKQGTLFRKIKFLICEYYGDTLRKEIVSAIKYHGGTIATKPTKQVTFLVQSWRDEDVDERLELCCNLGIVGVPFQYLQDCVAAETLTPFHLWCMKGATPSPYLNPVLSPSLGSKIAEEASAGNPERCCVLGEADWQAREREELNQSVHEHKEQKWPSLMDEENRSVVYVLPFESVRTGARGNPKGAKASKASKAASPAGVRKGQLSAFPGFESTDSALLSSFAAFVGVYFACTVKVLKKVPLKVSAKSAIALTIPIECQHAVVEGVGKTQLLSVLDLLDAVATKLPSDGYCILGVTQEDIYEGDSLDGMMRGRAFGGSRIAVFSTACYGRSLALATAAEVSDLATSRRLEDAARLDFAYQLATLAHETMHCFGLDHCGLYACCMNSWSDEIHEFSPKPNGVQLEDEDGVEHKAVGCVHVCPICVRKLQIVCGFTLEDRYVQLEALYGTLGLVDQQRWCQAVLRIGADAAKKAGQ
jgi:predicted Zn-dependent protease